MAIGQDETIVQAFTQGERHVIQCMRDMQPDARQMLEWLADDYLRLFPGNKEINE